VAQTLSDIKTMLAARGIHPRKRFGQNFLIDHQKLTQIVEAANITSGDIVLEVGPGTGVLTEAMLEAGANVIAAEVDRDMCAILRERLGDNERFTLIEGDAMAGKHVVAPAITQALPAIDPTSDIPHPTFKLIANLPYSIASPLLATLVLDHPAMTGAVVMVQREVGDRLAATTGRNFGPLSVVVQAGCEVERIAVLPPGCFWPAPQVDSVVIRLRRRTTALTDDLHGLAALAQQLFQKRRKQIGSVLGRDRTYPPGIEPSMRPEQLTVEQLVALQG
jgi:16S rRNA (adenine1518-N6/adenine1519-N6)-dimethyltransferase